MTRHTRLLSGLVTLAGLWILAGCNPVRELEDGEPLLDRFWQGVPRDAFGENLDEPTVRDVRRVLRLPVGCVASFDRDSGMLFARAPAEELLAIDRRLAHAEPSWEGPIQLQITASLWISPATPPNPWDPPQTASQVLRDATPVDHRRLVAFIGGLSELRGSEPQPLPPGATGDDIFDEEDRHRWLLRARTTLADDEGNLDVEFTYEVRAPKPDEPGYSLEAALKSHCLFTLGQPQVFELGVVDWRQGKPGRLVLALEVSRINPMGLEELRPDDTPPSPAPEPAPGDVET